MAARTTKQPAQATGGNAVASAMMARYAAKTTPAKPQAAADAKKTGAKPTAAKPRKPTAAKKPAAAKAKPEKKPPAEKPEPATPPVAKSAGKPRGKAKRDAEQLPVEAPVAPARKPRARHVAPPAEPAVRSSAPAVTDLDVLQMIEHANKGNDCLLTRTLAFYIRVSKSTNSSLAADAKRTLENLQRATKYNPVLREAIARVETGARALAVQQVAEERATAETQARAEQAKAQAEAKARAESAQREDSGVLSGRYYDSNDDMPDSWFTELPPESAVGRVALPEGTRAEPEVSVAPLMQSTQIKSQATAVPNAASKPAAPQAGGVLDLSSVVIEAPQTWKQKPRRTWKLSRSTLKNTVFGAIGVLAVTDVIGAVFISPLAAGAVSAGLLASALIAKIISVAVKNARQIKAIRSTIVGTVLEVVKTDLERKSVADALTTSSEANASRVGSMYAKYRKELRVIAQQTIDELSTANCPADITDGISTIIRTRNHTRASPGNIKAWQAFADAFNAFASKNPGKIVEAFDAELIKLFEQRTAKA